MRGVKSVGGAPHTDAVNRCSGHERPATKNSLPFPTRPTIIPPELDVMQRLLYEKEVSK